MVLSQENITQNIEHIYNEWLDQDIRYVICELADMAGMARSKIIPLSEWKRVAENGLRMIGVMVTVDSATMLVPETHYSEERAYGDAILRPDLATAATVPWRQHMARVICDPYWPDGTPLDAAPRQVLRRVLTHLQNSGYICKVALETEFYLMQDQVSRDPVFNGVHIFHTARNLAAPVLTSIMDALPRMGIEVLTLNAEYGTGQYEITFREQQGMIAADQAYTYKQAVKDIAREQGYHATFMTKPFPDQSASGTHVHVSLLTQQGENAFLDSRGTYQLSDVAYHFIAGMLTHAPAALALLNPTPHCFERFTPHAFAPVNISWGIDDRTSLVRAKPTGDEGTHLENRLPSALSNPYLATATTLASGLLGLQEARMPHQLVHEPSGENTDFPALPSSLEEALTALEQDTALREILGMEFTEIYLKVKRQELIRQNEYVQSRIKAAQLEWQSLEYLADY